MAAREVFRRLTERERMAFTPKLAELNQARAERRRVDEAIERLEVELTLMGSLLEPEILEEESGIGLDLDRLAFTRPVPVASPAGAPAAPPVPPTDPETE